MPVKPHRHALDLRIQQPETRIVVIGNAPVSINLSSTVDAMDIVVRFNFCPYYDDNTGTKTTILCSLNWGGNGADVASRAPLLTLPAAAQANHIWFIHPRQPQLFNLWHRCFGPAWKVDHTQAIINSNQLTGKTHHHLPAKLYPQTRNALAQCGATPPIHPTSGILCIEYLLQLRGADQPPIYAMGFSGEGWSGHAWQAEQDLLQDRIQQGRIKPLEPKA